VSWLRVCFLLLVAAVPALQMKIDRALGEFRAQEEMLYLWSGKHVQALCPGLEMIVADLYWLRTVQYFGGRRLFAEGKNFDLLYPLIEITVTLDPRFEVAYRYGATFLSEPAPVGAGRPEEGIRVLERATEAMPDSWRLRQELGYFHYIYLNDARTASRVLLEAAEIPGAAFWLRSLAASLLVKGGERQAARHIWQAMYDQAEQGPMKDNARQRLSNLDALDAADQLSARVEEFARRFGRRPETLAELHAAGLARGPAVDPSGTPFDYDRATGKVTVARTSPVWRPE